MQPAAASQSSDHRPNRDTEPERPLSLRIYAGLLGVYPADFRRQYAGEMVVLFADQLRDARHGRGKAGVVTAWIWALIDLSVTAAGEHLRRNRTVADSLTTFEPTRSMRWLGLFGLIGGLLLLAAFLTFAPFETQIANTVRLVVFTLGGAAIALAFHRRQALVAPSVAYVTTTLVVLAGGAYALWTIASQWVSSPFLGTFGALGFVAGIALWLSAAIYGAGALTINAIWRGMRPPLGLIARLGAIALLGSAVAWLGDDRLGLVDSDPYGRIWSTVAMAGVALNGIGWVLLGTVLVLSGRAPRPVT